MELGGHHNFELFCEGGKRVLDQSKRSLRSGNRVLDNSKGSRKRGKRVLEILLGSKTLLGPKTLFPLTRNFQIDHSLALLRF